LSGQDQELNDRESGIWVPASAHKGEEYESEDDDDRAASIQDSTVNGETRGRQEVIA